MKLNIKDTQKAYLDWEMGAIFHFGIRTFYQDHFDWDGKEMPLDKFNPVHLDCENWAKAVKAGGAKYGILVCKHHDGFANWPSKYTEYCIKNTPFMDGKGDVVKAFTDAFRKHGLKIGLYYSPAEFGYRTKTSEEYDDYFINQISELLTNYGKIDYLWFDGCGSENHEYDKKRIISHIRSLQKDILIFNMWDPDTRWVGNEAGFANLDNPLFTDALDFSILTKEKDALKEVHFLPAECDFRLRKERWFYGDDDMDTVKSVDELMGIYDRSVGRSANYLINIAPDPNGLIQQKDADTLSAFYQALQQRFAHPLNQTFEQQADEYTVTFEQPTLLNTVVLQEFLSDETDNYIEDFSITASPFPYGDPITLYVGKTVGHKAICSFPAFTAKALQVHVKAKKEHRLTDVKTYYAK